MRFRPALFLICLTAAAACSAPERFYNPPPVVVSERIPSRYASVEVLDVSLPAYAAGEELFVTEADGALRAEGLLWAEDPTRTITLSLTRALAEITRARVAPEPWPFEDLAEARVDVRVERYLAVGGRTLTLRGQYFVAPRTENGRERARLFDLSRPLPPEPNVAELLTVQSALVGDLATMIARDGLR